MNLNSPLLIFNEAYVRAAPDPQLSLPQSNLLTNLLKEEDQYQYNELINTSISIDIQPLLNQVGSCLLLTIFIITSLCHSSSFSYVHFFIFHLLPHGWLLFYSKNLLSNNLHSISSPFLLVSHSHLNIKIHHHNLSTMNFLLNVFTSIILNIFM
jgi:hypothetical protein